MGLEALYPSIKVKKMFNEGPALYECAICQFPPIHYKARHDRVTF